MANLSLSLSRYLTSIKSLAKGNTLGRNSHVGVLVNNSGRLAAELEGQGGQVDGSRLHDDLGDGAVAGVEDVVPLVLEQLGGLVGGAVDDQEGLAVEVAGQEFGNDFGRVLGHL